MNVRTLSNIHFLVIHCAVTKNGSLHHDVSDIEKWHKERGFARKYPSQTRFQHIGYHDVIECDGKVTSTRGWNESGAHCYGFNNRSIGVCLMGTDLFTFSQWDALRNYVTNIKFLCPNIQIKGHYDFSSYKTCPNFNVEDWLSNGMEAPSNAITILGD